MRRIIVSVCMTCMWSGVALCQQSQPAASAPGPKVVHLNIHAAPLPVPSLKYDLLPPAYEVRPGNAALLYYQLTSRPLPKPGEDADAYVEKVNKLLEGPIDPQKTQQMKQNDPGGVRGDPPGDGVPAGVVRLGHTPGAGIGRGVAAALAACACGPSCWR